MELGRGGGDGREAAVSARCEACSADARQVQNVDSDGRGEDFPTMAQSVDVAAGKVFRCWRWRRQREWFPMVVVVVLLLVAMSGRVACFNVDTVTAVVHQGEPGSMFGFSVAQHIDQSTNWVLVGAPRAQTSQPGVERAGAVYRCRTDRVNSCQEIPFDSSGNNIKWNKTTHVEIEEKSNQWFGATVQSSGENGVIVACAPRYVYFSSAMDKREPVGTCYVNIASTTQYKEFAPCKNAVDRLEVLADQFDRQGFCQLGFSAAFSDGGRKLLIGAVGSWYWQGQLYNYNSRNSREYVSTNEGPPDDDDSYMGYSSAVGDLDGDGVDDYVVGIPKGHGHHGKIAMFTQNLENINNITGEQIGAYFGAALAVTDLNKDNKDDIIVGAPFYSNFDGLTYDTGRVYIYYQTAQNTFRPQEKDILDGKRSKSRFGMALSRLGDINYDGNNDLAVGAPYGGEDGRGVVYIYMGSEEKIITEAAQVIHAKDVEIGLSAFGSAISGGWDQDGNGYPDLVVGSYGSDHAVFLKSRPVVDVEATLALDPTEINIETKSCSLFDGSRVTCLTVNSCLMYKGVGVPSELDFDLSWELDVLQRNLTVNEQRAFYIKNPTSFKENNTYKLSYKSLYCLSSYAYIKSELLDKLTPIAVEFKFKLHERASGSRRRRDLEPIMNQRTRLFMRTETHIQKKCGKDNKCFPDLSLNAFRITSAHVVGNKQELEMMVIIENHKEDAYNSKLYVEMPPGVSFRNRGGVKSVTPVGCGTLDNYIVCDLGNPLPSKAKSSFTLRVTTHNISESTQVLNFFMRVNSSNPEKLSDSQNNTAKVEIPLTAYADIFIYGRSRPEQLIVNASQAIQNIEKKTQLIEHAYQLQNFGPSNTKEIELQILWPSHDRRGNPILQLEGRLQLNGSGSCNVLLITPENATKYGFARPYGGSIQIVLPQDQDKYEEEERGEGVVLACSRRRCTVIQCLVGPLPDKANFFVTLKARLNIASILRRSDKAQMYHIRSSASARIKSMDYKQLDVNVSRFAIARQSIITTLNTNRVKAGSKKLELWVIIVAVLAGILVLVLLSLLLWWCGFFKRRKPENEGYTIAAVKSSNIDDKIYE